MFKVFIEVLPSIPFADDQENMDPVNILERKREMVNGNHNTISTSYAGNLVDI